MITRECLKRITKDEKVLIYESDFAYFLPCKQLRNVISNFTVSFPKKITLSDEYRILPHGSVTLVLFMYHEEVYSFLFGPCTKVIKVGNIANKCDVIFIVEFQPAGFFPFSNLHQNELIDKIMPFSSINNKMDMTFRDIFVSSLSINELLSEVEGELLQNLRFEYPIVLTQIMQTIIEMEGVITSTEISDFSNYCERHINRLFNQYLGMSIKSFSRLVRINKALHLLNQKEYTMAFICEKLGYYDISHFTKDFKMVCKITPLQYKRNMSDFYNEIAKY